MLGIKDWIYFDREYFVFFEKKIWIKDIKRIIVVGFG